MVRTVSFKEKNNPDEVALTFKRDNWKESAKTLYMKHHLIPGNTTSEKVGMENRELYVRWRQDVHVRIYKNFPTEQTRDSLIAQLVEG